MVRISEIPTRLLALKYGADIVWGPEIVDKALITEPPAERVVNEKLGCIDFVKMPKNQVIFRTHPLEKQRLVFQLGSGTPALAVQAAKLVAKDVAAIDLNCGCPKPFSTTGGMGSVLLSDVDRLCAILVALVTEVGKPFGIGISAKIRLLDDEAATEAMVRRICKTGIIGLTIHLRTVPMRPREPALRARLARLVEVCKEEKVVLLANGDVKDRDEALAVMAESGVDGIMIARGAEHNPSCFRSSTEGGPLDTFQLARELLRTAEEYDNAPANTKYILLRILADKSKTAAYRKCQSAKGYAELKEALMVEEEKPKPTRRFASESARKTAAVA
ncbi:hypothetical protein BCR37DRAFT_349186 [Protomyces lactucae-debilis]|uniref:tRNA-dihydrouridine synthase n=1 Tax=Protomyces lactucae-debilis TaxID=2754530 RepID=A0A1Y2FAD6_PROLT|nr:uncharacterized protein BCR37DRAFT_349186 [Protomyces lactucae-debilis]ORY80306.1 hypothetical protein BCR37DRAFT_349186 [Protomyces lactucae-debilis]